MSNDGNEAYKFHEKCDNVGPTLTLIKANKDRIFGGFTPLSWKAEENDDNQNPKFDDDNLTFIFSLNLSEKYDLFKDKKDKKVRAITCNSEEGPNFGNSDFVIFEPMIKGKVCSYENCSFFNDKNKSTLLGENKNEIDSEFETNEIEIFQVEY